MGRRQHAEAPSALSLFLQAQQEMHPHAEVKGLVEWLDNLGEHERYDYIQR